MAARCVGFSVAVEFLLEGFLAIASAFNHAASNSMEVADGVDQSHLSKNTSQFTMVRALSGGVPWYNVHGNDVMGGVGCFNN